MMTRRLYPLLFILLALPKGAETKEDRKGFEFTRMLAHWANYAEPGYLAFIDETKPDLVQLGFYGAHFWGLAHTPKWIRRMVAFGTSASWMQALPTGGIRYSYP